MEISTNKYGEPTVVFRFTLDELYFLESYIPQKDGFYAEILSAISELQKTQDRIKIKAG